MVYANITTAYAGKKEWRGKNGALRSSLFHWAVATAVAIGLTYFEGLLSPHVLGATITWAPETIDPTLYAIDTAFGFSPSVEVARLFDWSRTLRLICLWAYNPLTWWVTLVAAMELSQGRWQFMARCAVAAVLGSVLYFLFPAVGPANYFQGCWPYHLPAVALGPTGDITVWPRNAFPSLHTTWAALICIALWGWGLVWRVVGASFLGLIVLATLGSGNHYLVDLVAAIPLIAACAGLVKDEMGIVRPSGVHSGHNLLNDN